MRLYHTSRHPLACWLLLLILSGMTLYEVHKLYQLSSYNRLLDSPETIVQTDSSQPGEVIFAKALYLNRQGDYQQALRLFNQIKHSPDLRFQQRVLYNMGTIYLQHAAGLWRDKGVWESNQIDTLLDLAEQALRQVLAADPEHWQARYNLEYVLRIRPPGKEPENDNWTGHKSSVFAVMPGIPAGGP